MTPDAEWYYAGRWYSATVVSDVTARDGLGLGLSERFLTEARRQLL